MKLLNKWYIVVDGKTIHACLNWFPFSTNLKMSDPLLNSQEQRQYLLCICRKKK